MRGVRLSIVSALGVCGLLAMFWPTLSSGLARMQTDQGDTRHLNYVLEHTYRWARGFPEHRSLWSPPMFYPERNTAAYSETLLGVAPLYGAFRLAGAAPDTSLQLFTLTCALLNFAAAGLFFRRALRFELFPSAAAAYLFAYGSIRAVKVGHQHLIPHFYTLLAVGALVLILRETTSRSARRLWVVAFFAGMLAQLYACIYLTWLLGFALLVLAGVGIFFAGIRSRLASILREQAPAIAVSSLVSALLAAPLLLHHLAAARSVGWRDFSTAELFLAAPHSWLFTGPLNLAYGRFAALYPPVAFPFQKCLGLGFITTFLVLLGFWKERRDPAVRAVALASVVVMLCVTVFPGGFSAWRYLFRLLPGAGAIRAVSRIALVLLIPAAWGLALGLRALASTRAGRVAGTVLALLSFAEQTQLMPSYAKADVRQRIAALSARVPSRCTAFYYVARDGERTPLELQLDAMWASLGSRVPTVNGYSSNLPVGWMPLFANVAREEAADVTRVSDALARWAALHGIPPGTICVVAPPPGKPAGS